MSPPEREDIKYRSDQGGGVSGSPLDRPPVLADSLSGRALVALYLSQGLPPPLFPLYPLPRPKRL